MQLCCHARGRGTWIRYWAAVQGFNTDLVESHVQQVQALRGLCRLQLVGRVPQYTIQRTPCGQCGLEALLLDRRTRLRQNSCLSLRHRRTIVEGQMSAGCKPDWSPCVLIERSGESLQYDLPSGLQLHARGLLSRLQLRCNLRCMVYLRGGDGGERACASHPLVLAYCWACSFTCY